MPPPLNPGLPALKSPTLRPPPKPPAKQPALFPPSPPTRLLYLLLPLLDHFETQPLPLPFKRTPAVSHRLGGACVAAASRSAAGSCIPVNCPAAASRPAANSCRPGARRLVNGRLELIHDALAGLHLCKSPLLLLVQGVMKVRPSIEAGLGLACVLTRVFPTGLQHSLMTA